MEYRRFGKTEIRMPVISLGGMRYLQSWDRNAKRISRKVQENLERIVDRALELGINHFETARGYGTSERQLGRVLPRLDRDRVIVQTKNGPRDSAKEYLQDVEDSLKLLHLEHVDLLALHGLNNPEIFDKASRTGGCIEALVRLKERGVAHHIGFSTHAGPEMVIRGIRSGVFDYVNLWYSYMYQENWPAILEARRRDMGVFIISPTDKGGRWFDPPQKLTRLTKPLLPMQFNDLFILSHRQVHTISCGAASPSDFDPHVDAVRRARRLAPAIRRIKRRMEQEMNRAVGAKWARRYREGLPAWEDTPGQINIPTILWLRNLAKAFGVMVYARNRYNLLGRGSHWFPGNKLNKLAEIDLKALRRKLRRSPFGADEVIDALSEAHELLVGTPVERLGGRH